MVVCVFFMAYFLRSVTDGIPFVQLRIPYISEEQFIPFIISGTIIWGILFSINWLYTIRPSTPLFEELQKVLKYSFLWLIVYMSFVYVSTGFIFSKEIPRLIIFYVYIFSTFFSVFLRIFIHTGMGILYTKWYIWKNTTIVLYTDWEMPQIEDDEKIEYIFFHLIKDKKKVIDKIRNRNIQSIISFAYDRENTALREIISLSRIYGISFSYPKYLPENEYFSKREWFIGGIPTIELTSVSITPWERIIKRFIDILIAGLGLLFLFPLFIVIGIIIKIEDASGPVFFANRRIGQDGKLFSLYKFRYMYWKYSVKDAYGVTEKEDEALKFEENLKKENDTRDGPLYKIKNDPRKMRFGKILEKLSLDELPQLYNVLKWDMSIIGPRPHQPREVDLYDEEDKQVLTIKPWITGMAQVYWRERNTFKEEMSLDRRYIESYSLALDCIILARTLIVVFTRAIRWK